MRRWLMVLALLGALLPATALAHVKLASSNPAAGSTIASAPATLELVFDGEVGPDGLKVTVTGPGGARADQGDARLDLDDIDRKRVLASLKSGLAGGAYAVDWVVIGADGHEITGSFSFTIQGAAPAPTATTAP
ncbi:MAG TPA: copper resistance protein CopC, partial [Herpetosiphonaceae bacterium]